MSCHACGTKKNSESPWGIEPQTFRFHTPMFYPWATETQQWARSITKFIWHVSYILLGSAMSIASRGIFSFVPHLWQDEKDLSLFFYPAQNLPSLLFTINEMLRWLKQLRFNLSSSIHMVYWHNPCWLSYWKL